MNRQRAQRVASARGRTGAFRGVDLPAAAGYRICTVPAALAVRRPGHVAAHSRAVDPTVPLWHAVETHRPAEEMDDACELTVCGVLARIVIAERWPTAARDVCPLCRALAP